jgi:hypothetical protein
MATAWMDPSWLIEHIVIVRHSAKKPSTSTGDILIAARWFPLPVVLVPVVLVMAYLLVPDGSGAA